MITPYQLISIEKCSDCPCHEVNVYYDEQVCGLLSKLYDKEIVCLDNEIHVECPLENKNYILTRKRV